MFTDFKMTSIFCYITSFILFGICTYVNIFEVLQGSHVFMKILMVGTGIVWLSVGHLNDVFFNLKTVLVLRHVAKNLDKITYVGIADSGTNEMFNFYLISDNEFYNILQINRLAYTPQFFAPICFDYRIGVTTEINKGAYAKLSHVFYTITEHYERLIHNHCVDLKPYDEGSLVERIQRIDNQISAKNSIVRKHTIDEILEDLTNE